MSNVRKRNITINDIKFDSDEGSDSSYNPSSDDYTSSQETDVYKEEEEAGENARSTAARTVSAYKFFYMYLGNKALATLLASTCITIISFFTIVYDMFINLLKFRDYFKEISSSVFTNFKTFIIFIIYFMLYTLALCGFLSVIFFILYHCGYLVLTPINYLVPYK